MRELRQGTAVTIVVGPINSITDATLIPAQDVTAIDCGIKKAGTAGAAITLTASGGDNDMTPTANNPGHYDLELTTGNLDTPGPLRMTFNKDDTFLAFWEDFMVTTAAEWDRKFSTGATVADLSARIPAALVGGKIDANVGTVTAGALAIAAFNADVGTTAYASNPIAKAICERLLSAMSTAGSLGKKISDIILQTGDSFARIGATGSGLTSLAQASVLGALATAAATGDPTSAKTIMGYVKQLVNVLVGSDGIATFPAEQAPGNGVSLAEVIRAMHVDVTGLNGSVMRGTDGAYTGTPPTTAQIQTELEENGASLLDTIADTIASGTYGLSALKTLIDAIQSSTDAITVVKKNTAMSHFDTFMVDSTDHRTGKTGLTVAAQRSIDGAAFESVTGTVTEIGNGHYDFVPAAADTNGDMLIWRFTAAGADATSITIFTTA